MLVNTMFLAKKNSKLHSKHISVSRH